MKIQLILFLALLSLTNCSMFTKQGRQERAYEHYLRKSQVARDRQRYKYHLTRSELRAQRTLRDNPEVSSPGPESVTAAAEPPSAAANTSASSGPPNEQP